MVLYFCNKCYTVVAVRANRRHRPLMPKTCPNQSPPAPPACLRGAHTTKTCRTCKILRFQMNHVSNSAWNRHVNQLSYGNSEPWRRFIPMPRSTAEQAPTHFIMSCLLNDQKAAQHWNSAICEHSACVRYSQSAGSNNGDFKIHIVIEKHNRETTLCI